MVAVRDAGTVRRALPLGLRLICTGGIAIAAWFLGATLGNFAAAADEAPHQPDARPAGHAVAPHLLHLVTTTLGRLAETVDHVAATVTEKVVQPITTTVLQAAPTPARADLPVKETPKRTATAVAVQVRQPPATSRESASTGHGPVQHRQAPRTQLTRPGTVDARSTTPALPPVTPGDPVGGITVSADTSGHGKHPLAVLDWLAATPEPALSSVTPQGACLGGSGLTALPDASPD